MALAFGLALTATLFDGQALFLLAPMLVLAGPLCLGWFVGERQLERWRSRRRAPASRLACAMARPRLAIVRRPAGLGVAFSLAQRPPPRAALTLLQ
jgi:hypothetical protein